MIDELIVPDTLTIFLIAITSLVIAGIAFYKKVLDQGGSALAFLICFVSGTFGHWSWLLLLLIFVGSSFLATRFAIVYKMALGVEESDAGTRGGSNVVSNGIVPPLVAICYSVGLLQSEQALVAFTTSIAAATADTMASEIGVLSPKPVLITNPRKSVEPGTNGGISLEGTVASLLSAVSMSMLSFSAFILVIEQNDSLYVAFNINFLYISAFFGFFGSIIDSLLGATLENRGILDNNGVNFFSIASTVIFSLILLSIL